MYLTRAVNVALAQERIRPQSAQAAGKLPTDSFSTTLRTSASLFSLETLRMNFIMTVIRFSVSLQKKTCTIYSVLTSKALCSTRLTCPIKAVSWVHKTFLTVLWNSWTDTNKIFCISNFLSKHFLPLPLFDITRKLFSHLRKYQPWSTGYEITSLSQNTTSF